MAFITRFFEIISPILYGIALAYLFAPLQNFFEYKIFARIFKRVQKNWVSKLNRVLALIVTLLLITLLIAAAFNIIIPGVAESAQKLADNLGPYISSLDNSLENYLEKHVAEGSFIGKVYHHVKQALGVDADNTLFSKLIERAANWLIGLFSEDNIQRILSLGSSVLTVLINIVLAIIFMIYLLFSKERQAARVRKILTALFKKERLQKIYRAAYMTDERVGQFMRTRIIESILVGIVSYFVYLILDLPYAPLMALISGVTNIIPYFGPFIGAIPDGMFVLMAVPDKLFAFIIAVLIIQQIDGNVLAPIMQSATMKIDAFWVLAGLTIMGGVFGLPGLIIGVPVFAVIYILIREKVEAQLKKKSMPTETAAYEVPPHERKIHRQKPPIVRSFQRIRAHFQNRKKGDLPQGGADADASKEDAAAVDASRNEGAADAAKGDATANASLDEVPADIKRDGAEGAPGATADTDVIDRFKSRLASFFGRFKKK